MRIRIGSFVAAVVAVFIITDLARAGTTTYQYDALGRVTTVTEGAAVVRYYYDPAGNRTKKETEGGTATVITMPSSAVEQSGSVVLRVSVGGTSTAGTVKFYEGSTYLGEAPVVSGVATVELIGLTLGSHNITAVYSGDVAHAAVTSAFPIHVANLDWLPAVLDVLL